MTKYTKEKISDLQKNQGQNIRGQNILQIKIKNILSFVFKFRKIFSVEEELTNSLNELLSYFTTRNILIDVTLFSIIIIKYPKYGVT